MRRQRQQGQGNDRALGKMKVTEGGLRAISYVSPVTGAQIPWQVDRRWVSEAG